MTDIPEPTAASLPRLNEMNRVSASYVPARYVSDLPWTLAALTGSAVAAVVVSGVLSTLLWCATGALTAVMLWQTWLIPAQASRRRWVETADELLIAKGRLWRTFTVVPYGRIQYVDVTAGPVERGFRLKRINLHTASSTSDARVVGLSAADADALRDRLAVAARERMSGL